ncbi:MAG: phage tail protein [Gammaproteobacteria bacterium]
MTYPLTSFHFQVEWAGARLGFTEVSGLDVEHDIIEYREGNSPSYTALKMPGLPKHGNVTLKRGIVLGDNEFFDWLETIQLNQVERRDLTIQALNEQHDPVVVWRLRNAWPVALKSPRFRSTSSDVAIETLEVAHEGMKLVNG